MFTYSHNQPVENNNRHSTTTKPMVSLTRIRIRAMSYNNNNEKKNQIDTLTTVLAGVKVTRYKWNNNRKMKNHILDGK